MIMGWEEAAEEEMGRGGRRRRFLERFFFVREKFYSEVSIVSVGYAFLWNLDSFYKGKNRLTKFRRIKR